jgi:hypothetical protein
LKHRKIKASKLKKVFQMTTKQSTLKAIKARVRKKSKRNFFKQSLREMPRICRLLEEVKKNSYGQTNATRISIRR